MLIRFLCFLTVVTVSSSAANADDPITYQTHIQKLFRAHCISCHRGSDADAGLDLSTYEATLAGSDSGDVLVPGDPQDSLLYLCVSHLEAPEMPPGEDRLGDEVIRQLERWISAGMPESLESARSIVHDDPNSSTPPPHTANRESRTAAARSGMNLGPVFEGRQSSPVNAVAVSNDGKRAAIGGQHQVLVYDLATGSLVGVLPFPEGEVLVLRFGADDSRLLAGGGIHGDSGRVVIWDAASGRRLHELGDEYDVVLAADISPDGRFVLLGGPAQVVTQVDLESGEAREPIDKHTDWIMRVSFSPEGLIFASADRAGNVYIWETESGDLLHTLRGHRGAVSGLGWSADGTACVTAGEDGSVRLWDMHTGQPAGTWQAHDQGVLHLTTRADRIITGGRDRTVRTMSFSGQIEETLALDALPVSLAPLSAGVLVGRHDGRSERQFFDGRSAERLTVPAEWVTRDFARIDRTVESPGESMPARRVTSAPAATSPIEANAPNRWSGAAEAARIQLEEISRRLPAAIEEMKAAETELMSAAQAVLDIQRQIDAQNDVDAASEMQVDELLDLRERIARLAALVTSLTSAQELADAGSNTEDARLLIRMAREKATDQLTQARAARAAAENAAATRQQHLTHQRQSQLAAANRTLTQATERHRRATHELEAIQAALEDATQSWRDAASD